MTPYYIKCGWAGWREGFHGPFFIKRRAFTRFGPKTAKYVGLAIEDARAETAKEILAACLPTLCYADADMLQHVASRYAETPPAPPPAASGGPRK